MSGNVDASDVEVEVKNGVVTLRGNVSSREDKYDIEELADSIGGVKDVKIELRVKRERSELDSDDGDYSSSASGSSASRSTSSAGTTSNTQ